MTLVVAEDEGADLLRQVVSALSRVPATWHAECRAPSAPPGVHIPRRNPLLDVLHLLRHLVLTP